MALAETDFGVYPGHSLKTVSKQILSDFGQPTDVAGDSVADAFQHHFSVTGKQTRATLTLITSHRLGLVEQSAVRLAACVEALHNASLVQDDLQDGALTRRGQPTVYSLFGEPVALGLTTRLIATAFQGIQSFDDSSIRSLLFGSVHNALSQTISGQNRDLEAVQNRSVEDLLRIAEDKSGPLFALSLQLPLLASGFTEFAMPAKEAACQFGLGYQLLDDIKDREIDRIQLADSNIVNTLMRQPDFDEMTAVREAKAMATEHLKASARLADALPNQSGSGLQALSKRLLDSLKFGHV